MFWRESLTSSSVHFSFSVGALYSHMPKSILKSKIWERKEKLELFYYCQPSHQIGKNVKICNLNNIFSVIREDMQEDY